MGIYTVEQMAAKLLMVKAETIPAIELALNRACLNIEGLAKENCTPGKSPYYKAPFDTGTLRANNRSLVEVSEEYVQGTVYNAIEYAIHVHEGTSRMKARPFILDAVKAKEPETLAILENFLVMGIIKHCDVV